MNWNEIENKDLRLKYQNNYIKLLEMELFNRSTRSEMESISQESIDGDYEPTWRYRRQMEALKKTLNDCYEVLKVKEYDPAGPILIESAPCGQNPPSQWILPRCATIGSPQGDFLGKQVILKYQDEKDYVGLSIYLSEMTFSPDIMGLVIQKFFMDLCVNRIKKVTETKP